ncbi:unnamed protein product [Caenorhabditis angaria]|uniref:Uncharacterized protein n=1 Tax=Caenorhabditis angaria TaxID=860376 RepID=A0A9P1J3E2_9PELO|nr:unnamed protein product [Caenorhabditis angaria]
MSESDPKTFDRETIHKAFTNTDTIAYFMDNFGENDEFVETFGQVENGMKTFNEVMDQPLNMLMEQFLLPKFEKRLTDLENVLKLHEDEAQLMRVFHIEHVELSLTHQHLVSMKELQAKLEKQSDIISNINLAVSNRYQEKLSTLNAQIEKAIRRYKCPQDLFDYASHRDDYEHTIHSIKMMKMNLLDVFEEIDSKTARKLFDRTSDMRVDVIRRTAENAYWFHSTRLKNNPEFAEFELDQWSETISKKLEELEIMREMCCNFLQYVCDYFESTDEQVLCEIPKQCTDLRNKCQNMINGLTDGSLKRFLTSMSHNCNKFNEEMLFNPDEPSTSDH